MSIYVDKFLQTLNTIIILDAMKKSLIIEYNMKNLGEVKTIIRWQMTRDIVMRTMKID